MCCAGGHPGGQLLGVLPDAVAERDGGEQVWPARRHNHLQPWRYGLLCRPALCLSRQRAPAGDACKPLWKP